uniref:PAT1 homolog 2 n=1 Tax=Mastacembelus armatus TaxID=205130 RepID=A0A3Q3MAT6_9TELE
MSDSEQQQEAEKDPDPLWPENGEQWSDGEEETSMECGLLQAMAEEDEESNLYNEETFGMGVYLQCTYNITLFPHRLLYDTSLLQFEEPPTLPPEQKPQSPQSSPSPPRQRPQYVPRGLLGRGRCRGQRGGLGRVQMFEDPAVMRIVEGRPSLKSLDSAIVDCGIPMYSKTFDDDVRATFLRFILRTGGFMVPLNHPCPSTPQALTPKIMQLRFGANSPRPSPFYSPSSNPVQLFRYPGPVTQLHPQHKRILSQKQHIKPEGWDPYCNLMTVKEKEWITRLQMIQLQSENPYLEDYYYQEYYRRIEAKMAEEELGIRSRKEPPKLTTPYIMKTESYTPVVHIEGSLGQVAVSTCYSPRRAIGAVHAVQAQGPLEIHLHVTGTKRHQRCFLNLFQHNEFSQTFLSRDSGGDFLPFLLVSKGKKLLARLIPFLKHDSALTILHTVSFNLPTLMSRDTEEALPVLYPALRNVIGGLTFSQLIRVLKDLTSSESLSTYESLTLTCQNKFGLSLLYALLSQGEKLLSSGVPLEPSIGDFETWTDTIFQVAGQLSQCSLVEPLLLPSNLLTLFCRYLDKRTVHQLKSNMESATGFLALPS